MYSEQYQSQKEIKRERKKDGMNIVTEAVKAILHLGFISSMIHLQTFVLLKPAVSTVYCWWHRVNMGHCCTLLLCSEEGILVNIGSKYIFLSFNDHGFIVPVLYFCIYELPATGKYLSGFYG